MSQTPTLILTRPRHASEEVALEFPDVPVIISPVIEIVGLGAKVDLTPYAGVILTSANAVPFLPDLTGVSVYCVGRTTAAVSGGDVRLVASDAADLIANFQAEGPVLHAHGRITRGDVVGGLKAKGFDVTGLAVYDAVKQPLTPEVLALIEGEVPSVLPLWSPRSARLVADQVRPGPNLRAIAISQAAANEWSNGTGAKAHVCAEPTGAAMRERIVAELSR